MAKHLPECRVVIHRPPRPPYFETFTRVCAPECPVHTARFSPVANAAAALRYMRGRYSRPWATASSAAWRGAPPPAVRDQEDG